METSDLIGIIDVLVTIFVGYFLANRFSVHNTRTRANKDYYIQELRSIKKDVERVIQELIIGGISAKSLVKSIDNVESRLREFDISLRIVLPIYITEIHIVIGDILDKITALENINDQFENETITLSSEACSVVKICSNDIHKIIAEYLYVINIADSYSLVHELKINYINIFNYYKTKNEKICKIKTIFRLICKYRDMFLVVLFFIIIILIFSINSFTQQTQKEEKITNKVSVELQKLPTTSNYNILEDPIYKRLFPSQMNPNSKDSKYILEEK